MEKFNKDISWQEVSVIGAIKTWGKDEISTPWGQLRHAFGKRVYNKAIKALKAKEMVSDNRTLTEKGEAFLPKMEKVMGMNCYGGMWVSIRLYWCEMAHGYKNHTSQEILDNLGLTCLVDPVEEAPAQETKTEESTLEIKVKIKRIEAGDYNATAKGTDLVVNFHKCENITMKGDFYWVVKGVIGYFDGYKSAKEKATSELKKLIAKERVQASKARVKVAREELANKETKPGMTTMEAMQIQADAVNAGYTTKIESVEKETPVQRVREHIVIVGGGKQIKIHCVDSLKETVEEILGKKVEWKDSTMVWCDDFCILPESQELFASIMDGVNKKGFTPEGLKSQFSQPAIHFSRDCELTPGPDSDKEDKEKNEEPTPKNKESLQWERTGSCSYKVSWGNFDFYLSKAAKVWGIEVFTKSSKEWVVDPRSFANSTLRTMRDFMRMLHSEGTALEALQNHFQLRFTKRAKRA